MTQHNSLHVRTLPRSLFPTSLLAAAMSALMSAPNASAQISSGTSRQESIETTKAIEARSAQKPVSVVAAALITEVRAWGPSGAEDSFVEVGNTGSEPLDISNWSLRFLNGAGKMVTVPVRVGTILPPRGHLLFAGRRYSLSALAQGDVAVPERIAGAVQLCDAVGKVVDMVGSSQDLPERREGAGLPAWTFTSPAKTSGMAQFASVRRFENGQRRDSGDNRADWHIVSVSGSVNGHQTRLGAPGPQNLGSSRQAIGPRVVRAASPVASPAGARVVPVAEVGGASATGDVQRPQRDQLAIGANKRFGTLVLRHRLVNETGATLKRFRLHVVGASSGRAPSGTADVRLLPLTPALKDNAAANAAGPRRVLYGVLDEPPTQRGGGGLNSSLLFDAGLRGLSPGEGAEIRVLLGVETTGNYRLLLDGGGLSLSFSGHTQPGGVVPATAGVSWHGGSGAWSFAATSSTSTSGRTSSGAGSQSGGGNRRGKKGNNDEESPFMAVIIFDGHTEDGVEPPVADSTLKISSGNVVGAAGGIMLTFAGSLDPASVEEVGLYSVEVNGRAVQVASASMPAPGRVLLRMPENLLRRGDKVLVRWTNLRDARGLRVSGQIGPISVP